MQNNIESCEITRNDQIRWNKLLFSAINSSFISSIPYAYAKVESGRKITTFIFQRNGEDIAGAHYSLKRDKNNLFSTADILSGFVFKEEPTGSVVRYLVKHFIQWSKAENVSYLRYTPWLPKIIGNQTTGYESLLYHEIMEYGFRPILSGRHTYWIDLQNEEEVILANMKRQTRYEIRKGLKSELITEKHNKPDNELFETFWRLYNKLGKQKGFNTLMKTRFKEEIYSLMNDGLASLFVIKYRGEIVNISFSSSFGRASYLYGAMNLNFKDFDGCPSPGPLAQWEMIRAAKSAGLNLYDMGFCPGPTPEKSHPRFKMWRFKYGFGGDHVEFLPVYGKALQPLRGRLFQYIKYRK